MTIYLGNISYEATEAQVYDLLTPYGTIFDLNYPLDRVTRRPRGFAFFSLADRGSAEAAIQALNGADFLGRTLRASEPKQPELPSRGMPVGFRKQGEQPIFGGGRRR